SFTTGDTILAVEVTVKRSFAERASIVSPCSSASALSAPKRELAPPASTYPQTHEPSFTPHPPWARALDAEFQVRAIFPANFGGANQSSQPYAKHSSGGLRVVS